MINKNLNQIVSLTQKSNEIYAQTIDIKLEIEGSLDWKIFIYVNYLEKLSMQLLNFLDIGNNVELKNYLASVGRDHLRILKFLNLFDNTNKKQVFWCNLIVKNSYLNFLLISFFQLYLCNLYKFLAEEAQKLKNEKLEIQLKIFISDKQRLVQGIDLMRKNYQYSKIQTLIFYLILKIFRISLIFKSNESFFINNISFKVAILKIFSESIQEVKQKYA